MSILSKSLLPTALFTSFFLFGIPAHANAGLPMLVVVWPAMWALLAPIVILETVVAVQCLHMEFAQAFRMVAIANLFSTAVGIPITWFVLLCIEMRVGKRGSAYDFDTLKGKILSVTVQSPWLLPYSETEIRWMIPAAELFLCVPCFLMSVWTEFLAAKWSVQNQITPSNLFSWSWTANGLTYGIFLIVLLIMIFKGLRKQENSKRKPETWLHEAYMKARNRSVVPVAFLLATLAMIGVKPRK